MSLYQPQNAGQDDSIVDDYVRYHFRGVDGLPLEPPPPAPVASESGQPEPSEDEQFNVYMATHFPSWTSAKAR